MEDSNDEKALSYYKQRCKDYLNQFEKITSVTIEALWNDDNIRDGTYKDIIADELKSVFSETEGIK